MDTSVGNSYVQFIVNLLKAYHTRSASDSNSLDTVHVQDSWTSSDSQKTTNSGGTNYIVFADELWPKFCSITVCGKQFKFPVYVERLTSKENNELVDFLH